MRREVPTRGPPGPFLGRSVFLPWAQGVQAAQASAPGVASAVLAIRTTHGGCVDSRSLSSAHWPQALSASLLLRLALSPVPGVR